MHQPTTVPNPDLEVIAGNLGRWNHADHRRKGFHSLHRIARYVTSLRASRVMPLEKCWDLRIASLECVRQLTAIPWFSAMVVVRGQHVLFERYAADFDKDTPHSIQSISKTVMNLVVGRLVEEGVLNLSARVLDYLPEIGSGYAEATLQQVMNMDVSNDYSEDFNDPSCTYYRHEEAMGWRLGRSDAPEPTQRKFLATISSPDITNRAGHARYKDANPDVMAWVVERASGRSLRSFLADIVDGAGLEGAFHITVDREGFAGVDGGVCVTARDLARYLMLFVRRGRGVCGQKIGSAAFIDQTLCGGVPMAAPYEGIRYSNNLMVSQRTLGHSGWGGQCALANVDTGTVAVFFSVAESQYATGRDYIRPVARMLELITAMLPEGCG